ncbi:MAG: DUF3846 domain-containing protein [Candidatus Paceibacterota bacterium]|jgi:hypothetical protein
MAQIITTNDQSITVEPKNGIDFKLEEIQEIIGGYMECVYLPNKLIMVVDEEGKIKNKPVNYAATAIFQAKYGNSDIIVGDVLLCKSSQIK